ncbi:MAG: ferredoxin family protein [Anaerofustis sp.]
MAKGIVRFDEDNCKGCELCIEVCPQKVISISKDRINAKGYHPAYAAEPGSCTGCGNCAVMCPDSIITVERD